MKLVLLLEKEDRLQKHDFLLPNSPHDNPVPVNGTDCLIGEIPNGRAYREPSADDCIKHVSFNEICNAIVRSRSSNELAMALDPWRDPKPGPSFYQKEAIALINDVVQREGWDVIYSRIRDLGPMSFDQPQLFTGQTVDL